LLALAALAASGLRQHRAASHPAAAPLPGTDACVFIRKVYDWVVIDASTLIVYAPLRKDAYLLKLFAPVQELDFKQRVGFEDSDHNGSCAATAAILVVRDEIGPRRVPIVAFRKMTPEQANRPEQLRRPLPAAGRGQVKDRAGQAGVSSAASAC
jgi:hypothetical protein